MDGEDLLEGEIEVVEGFCILLGVCVLVFHAVTEPLTDDTDAAPHAVLVDLAKIEAAALDHIAVMGDGALDGRHGCFAGELADNVFLAFEVVIEGAFGHAGVLRDVFHGYIVEAMCADQALGRIQKLCFCPFRFLCECHESSCKEILILCASQHFLHLFYRLHMIYSIQEIERVRNDQWSKGAADTLPPHSLPPFPPVLSYLTRTLLLRKIGQGIRKMYLAPMRGFFYACMRVTGRWVICDRSRIQGLRRFWRCTAPVTCSTCH